MKKFIVIVILSLCCISMVFAQGKGNFRVGIRAGANMSTLYGLQSDGQKIPTLYSSEAKYKMKPGVRAGFVFDIGLTQKISIQPAIYYSWQRWGSEGQGYTVLETDTFVMKTKEVMSMQLVQIPVLVNFRIPFKSNENNAFVFGVGPYFSVALAGHDVMDGSLIDVHNTADYWKIRGKADFYKDERIVMYKTEKDDYVTKYPTRFDRRPYNRFDFGFTVAAGFELKKFYIGVACDFGVLNTANVNEWLAAGVKGYRQRNLNLQATVGYYF